MGLQRKGKFEKNQKRNRKRLDAFLKNYDKNQKRFDVYGKNEKIG